MRSWVSLLVAAVVVVAGVLLFRNKDQILSAVGWSAGDPTVAAATPGTPPAQAARPAAGGPGGPGGFAAPGGAPGGRARQPAAVITVAVETKDIPITVSAVGW